jgi:hypothetical protein
VGSLRFSIRDVREDDNLFLVATTYAREYSGEFEFMQDIKTQIQSGIPLNEYQVRAVLNCMIFDPRAQHLIAARTPTGGQIRTPTRQYKPRGEKIVPIKQPSRMPFNVAIRWNMGYLISLHPAAETWHLVDPDSAIEWVPAWKKFNCRIRTYCKPPYHLPRQNLIRLLKEPPVDRRACGICVSAEERRDR